MTMEKECKYCGKRFIPKHRAEKYCSERCLEEGARKLRNERNRIRSKMKKIANEKKPQLPVTIVNIAVEAKKEGLTYGQYVAKYGL